MIKTNAQLNKMSTKQLVGYLSKHYLLYETTVLPESIKIGDIEIKQIKTPKNTNATTCCGDIYGFYVNGKAVYLHDEILENGSNELFFQIVKLYNKILYRKNTTKARFINFKTNITNFAWVGVYTLLVGTAGYMIGQQEQQKKDMPEFEPKKECPKQTPVKSENQTVLYGDVRDFQIPQEQTFDTVKSNVANDTKYQDTLRIYGDIRDFVLKGNQNTK